MKSTRRLASAGSLKEISVNATEIKALAPKSAPKEIGQNQGKLVLEAEVDVGGIGMGVLSDGTPYLNQRGLASMCGVMNAHIGTISSQWNEKDQKPRVASIKAILSNVGFKAATAHIEIEHKGVMHYCYPAEVCLAILEYYAFDAGANCQTKARDNFRQLAGSKLRELIYTKVGYDPTGRNADRFKDWHDRIALNYQSAPRSFFHVFNEAHTIVYELILASAKIGPGMIVDISVGQDWSKFWTDNQMDDTYGERRRYPHNYPDTHPQAKSNPQDSWCYPIAALGEFHRWLQDSYLEGGKFKNYLKGKVSKHEIAQSVAELAIATLVPQQIAGPSN
jgi:hypothetical protein